MEFLNFFKEPQNSESPKNKSEEELKLEQESIEYRQKIDKVFSRENLTNIIGTELHDEWRASRKKEDGTFEPRIKTTKDEAWIKKNSTDQVDISNTDYEGLPEDWKAENKSSAEVIVNEIKENEEGGNFDNNFIEQASSVIHQKWLERNGEWANDEQKKPYDELSEEEKEKDRVITKKGLEKFEEMNHLKKAVDVAEQIISIVHSNKKDYVEGAVSIVGFNLDNEKINKLISDKAKETNVLEENIKQCLDLYSAGTHSDYADAFLAIKNPYTKEILWGGSNKQQYTPNK